MRLSYSKNVYEIGLKQVFKQFCQGILKHDIVSIHSKQEHIDILLKTIESTCKFYGFSFRDSRATMIIVEPKDKQDYWAYMGLFLLYYNVNKIFFFLDYHLEKYPGIHKDFINAIEFVVFDAIETSSLFDNTKRLSTVRRWIREKKLLYKKNVPQPIWKQKHIEKLRPLSRLLKEYRYTKKNNDFSDVFTHRKIITWCKGHESLAYLLNQLRKAPLGYITTSKGDHPFFLTFQAHFKFIRDKDGQIVFRNDLRKVANIVAGRSKKKFAEMRQGVNNIILSLSLPVK